MDWLKSSLATAQKQAAEAAEKAKVLAAHASVHARDYAEKASEKAKVRVAGGNATSGRRPWPRGSASTRHAPTTCPLAPTRAQDLAKAAAEEAQTRIHQLSTASQPQVGGWGRGLYMAA
jgi:hypothetical protein